ncbi:Tox-REase-5 domain-containing protein, partial [Actinomyces sp. ZJ308]|uniref:Tox-REase-5 domain-containing protein n=1 Tax=Actinomyces sp. ZJ308 TaxID=2708342 RepID=UPI001FB91558
DGGGWWGSWRARALAGLPSGVLGRLGADLIETTAGAGARTHRLRLALTQAGDSGGPLRLLRAPARVLAEHRAAREMAARSQLDAGPRRWVVTALAAATAATSLWIFFTVVPPLVADLNQRLTGLPPHHWFAGILEMLATVWESMSPTEKAALALIGTAAVLLSGGTLGLALEVGFGIATVMDAARPAASLARDPRGATGRYLATHSDLEIAADAALAAAAVIPGGRAAGTTARTAAKARRTTKPFARAQAARGLNPRAGIHQPGLRTPRPARSDGGPGLWGEGRNYGSPRSQAYEEQVTGVPIEHSYYVGGVEFDGFDGFALVDAKGPGLANPIKGSWSQEPEGKYGLLRTAHRQVEAVRATGTDTPIQWHIAEKDTFNELWRRQGKGDFPPEIELIFTPPN